jgi:hypothetical protein
LPGFDICADCSVGQSDDAELHPSMSLIRVARDTRQRFFRAREIGGIDGKIRFACALHEDVGAEIQLVIAGYENIETDLIP